MSWTPAVVNLTDQVNSLPTKYNAAMTTIAGHINNGVIHLGPQDVGLHSARPVAGNGGAQYYETDTGIHFIDDGTVWEPCVTIAALGGTAIPTANAVVVANSSGKIGTGWLAFPTAWYYADCSIAAKPVSVAADRYTLLMPNIIQADVGGASLQQSGQLAISLATAANWDTTSGTDYTVAAHRAGKDFYVYLCQPVSGATPVIKVSANATYPSGYNGTTSRKIGGFPCECGDVGTISGHPGSGYLIGDIIPNGVWDLKFRCETLNNAGMAWDAKTKLWAYIYMASQISAGVPGSVFGGTIWDSINWMDATDAGGVVGMRLPFDGEFQSLAALSNEGTNILNSGDPGVTGNHVDTNSRRMLSGSFLEDCCGIEWQWLQDQGYQPGTGGTNWYDHTGGKGQLYLPGGDGSDVKLFAGGSWDSGAGCGSRSRCANDYRWDAYSHVGFRLVARSITQ